MLPILQSIERVGGLEPFLLAIVLFGLFPSQGLELHPACAKKADYHTALYCDRVLSLRRNARQYARANLQVITQQSSRRKWAWLHGVQGRLQSKKKYLGDAPLYSCRTVTGVRGESICNPGHARRPVAPLKKWTDSVAAHRERQRETKRENDKLLCTPLRAPNVANRGADITSQPLRQAN
ncbi:hypothetical protein BCV70DRAFT_234105 [Testicularia cyperi]|uniref:Uncharacterized protein n=1 Tax=Testicularia cyperi TaxID=1882483 RepID=A0A317XFV8_9BASI|nr:hypothetical protein BCV70DRAFT_234105 [Testicularia cyperi]